MWLYLKRFLWFAFVYVQATSSLAQELWGAANSNYAGTMGHELNPASIVACPFKWEIHVLSGDVFAMNNYLFLRKKSEAIRKSMRGEAIAADRIAVRTNTQDKSAYASAFLKLPAFMYSTPTWGLGFHVSTRVLLSARGVPYHLANFMKEGFDFKPQQKINYSGGKSKVGAMNFHEAGITGGIALNTSSENYLTAGISLNYLYGLNSFYLLVNNINYNVQSDSLWEIYVANVEYGHATVDKGNTSNLFQKKGSGLGGSIGIQYYKNRDEAAYRSCPGAKKLKKYDYKIGFSIIDIGRIKFKTNASTFEFNDLGTNWFGIDTVKIKSIGNTDTTFSKQFFGTSNGSKSGSAYALWLPAAASLQVDYSVTPYFYVNLSLIQRIPINPYTLRRPNQYSLALRYERKRFEVSIPYSYYDYFRHRIGLCLRFGILTLGTDMIGPYTGLADAYGLDFYFGLKWQHFEKCKKKSKVRRDYMGECFQEL